MADPAADREEDTAVWAGLEWVAPVWAAWAALEWEDAEEAPVDRLRRDADMEVAVALGAAASDVADRS